MQRTDRRADRQRAVRSDRLDARLIEAQKHERVQLAIALLDARHMQVEQLDRRELTPAKHASELSR